MNCVKFYCPVLSELRTTFYVFDWNYVYEECAFLWKKKYSLEEVILAEDLSVPGEALVRQLALAVDALEALPVPRALKDFQDEPVQDGLFTTSTLWNGCCKHKHNSSENSDIKKGAERWHKGQLTLKNSKSSSFAQRYPSPSRTN